MSEDLVRPAVIETANLECRYGRTEAIHDLTFRVAEGSVAALIGPNGAGKTTTIRTLLNIRRPARGRASIFGVDSRHLSPRELQTIGHVSESQRLPMWMTVEQLLDYYRPFYPTWDADLCRDLVEQFELPRRTKIAHLSRGMRVKAALVSSLAYRPRLLVLDEPFSGLDPAVRDDLVRGVLTLAGQERWTVLISSHDLDDVERLVDQVVMLRDGRLLLSEALADLQARFRRIEITVDSPASTPHPTPEGWWALEASGRVVRFIESRYESDATERHLYERFSGAAIDVQPMTLREIFVALTRTRREGRS